MSSDFLGQEWLRGWKGSMQKWKKHKKLRISESGSDVHAWMTPTRDRAPRATLNRKCWGRFLGCFNSIVSPKNTN